MIHSAQSIALNDDIEEKESRGMVVAKLHNGEPCFEPPISLNYFFQKQNDLPIRYSASQGLLALREEIVKKYDDSFSIDSVIVSHGAVGAINLALTTILKAGDEVIVIEPFWPQYAALVELKNAKVIRACVDPFSGKISKQSLESLITRKTKLLILNNPVNPTGVVYSEQEVANIIALSPKGIYILVDEVYGKYLYDIRYKPLVEQEVFQLFRNSIIYINSFSKEYGMTGYRVGYCVLPNDMVAQALAVSQNTMTCISPLNQLACLEVLKRSEPFKKIFATKLVMLKNRKTRLEGLLTQQKIPFIAAQGAFYLFVDIGTDSGPVVQDLYRRCSIALVAGSDYGPSFGNHLRICYSTDDKSFEIFISYLSTAGFKEYR